MNEEFAQPSEALSPQALELDQMIGITIAVWYKSYDGDDAHRDAYLAVSKVHSELLAMWFANVETGFNGN